MNDLNKTCESCKYLIHGGADDNFRFACVCTATANTYIAERTPICENYKENKESK